MRRLALAALTALPLAAGAVEPQPPMAPAAPAAPIEFARGPMLGVELVPTTTDLRVHLGSDADRGVLIGRVLDGSAADQAGIRVGDLLVEIGGDPVSDASGVRHALARHAGDDIRIEVIRDGKRRTVDATLPDGQGPADRMNFGPFGDGDTAKRFEWTHPDGRDHGWAEGRAFEWNGELPGDIRDTVRKALEEAGISEGEVREQLREHLQQLDGDMDARIQELDATVEQRLERMEDRLNTLQDRLDAILDALED